LNTPSDPAGRLVRLLQELIRNACVNDGAGCAESRSAATLAAFFREYGLEGRLLARVSGRDNLILRIPGTDPSAPTLAFMGHTDVVPVGAELWDHDPFGGELVDGEIWGRGAVDMLNMTASQAVGFAEAFRAHGPFPGDLLYIALADEEASGHYGARWLTDEHWDTVACDCMVSEIGGYFIEGYRGRSAAVGVAEKGVAWLRISVRGTPGHGSMPFGAANAAERICRAAQRLKKLRFPVQRGGLYDALASAAALNRREELLLKSPFFGERALKKISATRNGVARSLHAASRSTASIGILRGGSKINMIPEEASLDLDVRLLPGETLDELLPRIRALPGLGPADAEIEVLEYFPPTSSNPSGALMEATASLLRESCPDARLLPVLTGGATDGRFWRRKGTDVYGFTLSGDEMSMERFSTLIHGRNERVSVAGLERSLDYFTRLPERFFREWGNGY
jgi:acetylornithine deacetylase/succinyl-diaminopimelate desuccinylase-like protein